jgi:hypothetical protein
MSVVMYFSKNKSRRGQHINVKKIMLMEKKVIRRTNIKQLTETLIARKLAKNGNFADYLPNCSSTAFLNRGDFHNLFCDKMEENQNNGVYK